MKKLKKLTSFLLALMLLLSVFSASASAAYTSRATSGSTRTACFYVTTKANYWKPGSSSITLKQNKGTYIYKRGSKSKTGKAYGYYHVSAVPKCGYGKKTISKNFSGSSIKINLEKNTTYLVTVSYDENCTVNLNISNLKGAFGWRWSGWKSTPSWRVAGSWKVSAIG